MKIETFLSRCRAAARKELQKDPRLPAASVRERAERICRAVTAYCRSLGLGEQGAAAGTAEALEKELGLPRGEAEALAVRLVRRDAP